MTADEKVNSQNKAKLTINLMETMKCGEKS